MAKTAAALVAEAKQRVEYVTAGQVARALERDEAILIDLREPAERAEQGAIPGAVAAPWGMLVFWDALTEAHYRAQRDANGRVVLHCAAGGRSALAADTLRRMGYASVTYLHGGFAAWKAAGLPVEEASAA